MITVLLVDDDVDDRFLFGKALQKTGLEVDYLQADGCNAAIKLMDEGIHPDIIFLDINMPGDDGYQCLKKFDNNPGWRTIPVIIYTTSGHPDELQRAAEVRAAGFLQKPNDVKCLSEKLQELIAPLSKAH